MASISWAGNSGNWATGDDWIGGVAPGPTDDATIGGSGTYTVTVSSSDAAHSLSVDDQGATVVVGGGGTLAIGSSVTVLAGILQLNAGGVISGGTLSAAGGAFQWKGGTVEAVTYEGTLDLSTNGALITVGTGGLKTVGVNGTGSGTINLSGQGSEIDFVGNQLLTTATVDIGTAANGQYLASVLDADPGANNGTLTLTGSTTIDQTNAYADIGGGDDILGDENGAGSITNNGTINATYLAGGIGGLLRINPNNFTNNGRITVGNASTLYLQATGAFVNTGVITADAGSVLVIGDPLRGPYGTDGTYSNSGTITGNGATVDLYDALSGSGSFEISNSALNLTYNMTTAQLNAFGGQSDTISIAGTINNASSVLSIGTGTSLGALFMDAAMIDGGTVDDNGSGWNPMNGAGGGVTFNGVTYDGTMNFLDGAFAGIVVTGSGLVVKGTGGTGNGTINMFDGFDDSITFTDNQTFDNATLNVESSDYQDLFQEDVNTKTGVLTLGPQFTLNQTGSIGIFDVAGGTIINQGTINAEAGKT